MFMDFWHKHGSAILIISFMILSVIILRYMHTENVSAVSSSVYGPPAYKPPRETHTSGPGKRVSRGESECRRVLEDIFKKRFDSIRPDFLKNNVTSTETANYNLELDCFNKELGIAVEYNGRQHYEYVPFFHKNKEAFHNQKYRDELKRMICVRNSINLIEVPYTVKLGDIREHIINSLQKKSNNK